MTHGAILSLGASIDGTPQPQDGDLGELAEGLGGLVIVVVAEASIQLRQHLLAESDPPRG